MSLIFILNSKRASSKQQTLYMPLINLLLKMKE